jgi:[ribosomal protein S18]-alanine N-acetyltransferase
MRADEFKVREYTEEDLEAIFRLDQVCFEREFRFDRVSMGRYAETKGAISLVVERAGEITGFVIVQVERANAGKRGYVVTLDVAREFRRRGLAGRLMGEAERRARQAGAAVMELHVYTENTEAICFYERKGYERVRILHGFYGMRDGGVRGGVTLLNGYLYRKDLTVL